MSAPRTPRKHRSSRTRLALWSAAVLPATWGGWAGAEDVTRDFQSWFNFNLAPPPAATVPLGPFPGTVAADGQVARGSQAPNTAIYGLVLDRSQVQGDKAAVVAPTIRMDIAEPITLGARAASPNLNVYVISNIQGDIAQAAGGAVSAVVRVQLTDDKGKIVAGTDDKFTFNVPGAVNQFTVRSVNIPGGNYQLELGTTIENATGAAMAGLINDVDFASTSGTVAGLNLRNRGMTAVVVASPTNMPDARAAIGLDRVATLPALRLSDKSEVTGSGINMGQIELGVPTSSQLGGGAKDHLALPAPRLTIDPQSRNTFFRDEHALAVAGVMAGQSATLAQRGVAPGAELFATAFPSYAGTEPQQILRAVHYLADVGPIASVINASFGVPNLRNVVTPDGKSSESMLYDWLVDRVLDPADTHKDRTVVVVAAGNSGDSGPGPSPGGAGYLNATEVINRNQSINGGAGGYNSISVGALDWDFQARVYFSSLGPTRDPIGRSKPDIVAPGTFILSTVQADLNNDGKLNDFERVFFGVDDLNRNTGRIAGQEISGTSFAAPMVAGAVALMQQYGKDLYNNVAGHGDPTDPRVLKAALLNTAQRSYVDDKLNIQGFPRHRDGGVWQQGFANPTTITSPLDPELGAGMLKVDQAMLQIRAGEARVADALPADGKAIQNYAVPLTWDEQLLDSNANDTGRVFYGFKGALVKGQSLRATLVWHRHITSSDANNTIDATDTFTYASPLTRIDLRSWWWDTNTKNWSQQLVSASAVDNVQLFNDYRVSASGDWLLGVVNRDPRQEVYGFARLIAGNPAAAGGRLIAQRSGPPDDRMLLSTNTEEQLVPIELASSRYMKWRFEKTELLGGADEVDILDDNSDFIYTPGQRYSIYFGHELLDNPLDLSSQSDWFDHLIDLDELVASRGWRALLSAEADAEGNLPPTLISDAVFLAELAADPALFRAYNFVVDVDGDGLFTPDSDGIGYFAVVPEPGSLAIVGLGALLLTVRRRRTWPSGAARGSSPRPA
jgi:hypothetical protein